MDTTFSALSDPTRRAILSRLAAGPASCSELVDLFDLTQQAVSRHIGILLGAGLLQQRKQGRQRICEFDPAPLAEASRWIDSHRSLWLERLNQLEGSLRERADED